MLGSLRVLGRRALCTASAEAPPTMFGVSGRYANALYAAAAKKQALSAVADDLTLLKDTLAVNPRLSHFVSNPAIPRDEKAKSIVKLLTDAKANDVTKNAMATLAEGGRLGDVVKVIDMYTSMITAGKGEVKAIITSAEPLPKEDLATLTKQLDAFLEPGQNKIELTTKVDPALVSGITIEIGDKFLDASVATQLKKLQGLLKEGLA